MGIVQHYLHFGSPEQLVGFFVQILITLISRGDKFAASCIVGGFLATSSRSLLGPVSS